MDSIFGDAEPQFAVNFGKSNQVIVELSHSLITKNEPVITRVINEEELAADRIFLNKTFWEMDVVLDLFAYENPLGKFNEVNQYLKQSVALWKHKDGRPYRNHYSDIVPFYIEQIKPFYLDQLDFYDKVLIKFKSAKSLELYGIPSSINITVDGLNLTTENGKIIITE